MTEHDPLCPWDTEDFRGNSRRCECKLIARVRADERARQVEVMAADARARQATRGGVDRIIARDGGAW